VQTKEIKSIKQIHRAFFILPFLLAGVFYIIKTIVSRRKATLLWRIDAFQGMCLCVDGYEKMGGTGGWENEVIDQD
jgi:hypothetical protein